MSGFTTTGATVFPKVEIFSPALHVWRSMTQWLGGMGIVVLSVALLPMLGIGGYRLLKAETPGGSLLSVTALESQIPQSLFGVSIWGLPAFSRSFSGY